MTRICAHEDANGEVTMQRFEPQRTRGEVRSTEGELVLGELHTKHMAEPRKRVFSAFHMPLLDMLSG